MEDQFLNLIKIFEPFHVKAFGKTVGLIGYDNLVYSFLPISGIQIHVVKWFQIQRGRYIAAGFEDYDAVAPGTIELFYFFVKHIAIQNSCNLFAGLFGKFLYVHDLPPESTVADHPSATARLIRAAKEKQL